MGTACTCEEGENFTVINDEVVVNTHQAFKKATPYRPDIFEETKREEFEEAVPSIDEAKKMKRMSSGTRRRLRQKLRFKVLSAVLRIKRDYRSTGNTLLMSSYPEYLHVRDNVAGKYTVELMDDHDRWGRMVTQYRQALSALPCSSSWTGLHWVGSTSVTGLLSKPVVDLMITTNCAVEATLTRIALEMGDPDWLETCSGGLRFPIGFFGSQGGEDWGFLQMPHYHALLHSLVECNLHILGDGSSVAKDQLSMRNFLNSDAGAELRQKYSDVKQELEQKIKNGDMPTADYNKGKNAIIQDIVAAAKAWEANMPTKEATAPPAKEAASKPGVGARVRKYIGGR